MTIEVTEAGAAAVAGGYEAAAVHEFMRDAFAECMKAMTRFPQPNPTLAVLTEEVGELAQAALHIREGKHADWGRVYREAVQVAAMAARVAIEGDPTVGAIPTKANYL